MAEGSLVYRDAPRLERMIDPYFPVGDGGAILAYEDPAYPVGDLPVGVVLRYERFQPDYGGFTVCSPQMGTLPCARVILVWKPPRLPHKLPATTRTMAM